MPVFDGLAGGMRAAAAKAPDPEGGTGSGGPQLFMLQAALLRAMA